MLSQLTVMIVDLIAMLLQALVCAGTGHASAVVPVTHSFLDRHVLLRFVEDFSTELGFPVLVRLSRLLRCP